MRVLKNLSMNKMVEIAVATEYSSSSCKLVHESYWPIRRIFGVMKSAQYDHYQGRVAYSNLVLLTYHLSCIHTSYAHE